MIPAARRRSGPSHGLPWVCKENDCPWHGPSQMVARTVGDAHAYQTLGEAVALANTEMVESLRSEDFREGVQHFVEKRAARFTGR